MRGSTHKKNITRLLSCPAHKGVEGRENKNKIFVVGLPGLVPVRLWSVGSDSPGLGFREAR